MGNTRPRILHVYKDYFPPVLGGVEMTINLLAEGCQHRFETAVLVNSGNRKTFKEKINGVSVIRVGEWGRAASAPFSPALVTTLAHEARKADILHFHHPNPTGDFARFLSRPTAPAVMTYHSDVVRQKRAMHLYGPLQNWMMSNCEVIMPTSPDYLASSEWLQRHKRHCTVVPLGIRTQEFAPTPDIMGRAAKVRARHTRPVVLFVGQLRYYKGLQYLINALPETNADLVIAGGGPMWESLQELARDLGIADRVYFLGNISDLEKLIYYHASDVFCMPSHLRSEAFGLSQVEAMASGLPVVSTTIPSGVPFVNKDGVSGLTVRPEDPMALAHAINTILADDDLKRRLSEGARHRATSEFDYMRMCEQVMQVYDRVLATKAAAKKSG